MKQIVLALALMLGGALAQADEPGEDCAALLKRIDAKLKIVRIQQNAFEKIKALEAQGRAAMKNHGDCATPLGKALRLLGE